MEYCLEILKRKMDGYLNAELEEKELGKWGKEAYYDLLKGGYVKKDKIVIYPFLKTISRIGLEIDEMNDIYPSTKADIELIQAILTGMEPCYFQIVVSVPELIYKNCENDSLDIDDYEKFKMLKKELENYIGNTDENSRIFECVKEIVKIQNSNETIMDMLQEQIVQFCNSLFDVEQKKLMPQLGLYPKKTYNNLGLLKLTQYLECFLGERNFVINVSYTKGNSGLSILV